MSRGLPRTEEDDLPDIRETLAQLDRRLADLRHQITDLAGTPEPAPPPPPPAHRSIPLPAAPPMEPEPWGLGAAPSVLDSARARVAAEGIRHLGSQIEQLLTMRERLLAEARELVRRYERRLDELEQEDISDVQAALDSLLAAAAPPAQEPRVLPPGAAPAAPAATPAGGAGSEPPRFRPAFFEGLVTVGVGGATRIQTIQVLEDSLSRVPGVDQIYIRRWHAGALWLELTLSGGVELIGELNRALPFPFAVQSATGQEIVIRLEGER